MNIPYIVYFAPALKRVVWVGSSQTDIRALPDDACDALGHELLTVQRGGWPREWRPMTIVGQGAIEIRARAGGAFRLLYIAKFAEAIYVLHVFEKKTRKTSPLDLAVARARLAVVRRSRLGV